MDSRKRGGVWPCFLSEKKGKRQVLLSQKSARLLLQCTHHKDLRQEGNREKAISQKGEALERTLNRARLHRMSGPERRANHQELEQRHVQYLGHKPLVAAEDAPRQPSVWVQENSPYPAVRVESSSTDEFSADGQSGPSSDGHIIDDPMEDWELEPECGVEFPPDVVDEIPAGIEAVLFPSSSTCEAGEGADGIQLPFTVESGSAEQFAVGSSATIGCMLDDSLYEAYAPSSPVPSCNDSVLQLSSSSSGSTVEVASVAISSDDEHSAVAEQQSDGSLSVSEPRDGATCAAAFAPSSPEPEQADLSATATDALIPIIAAKLRDLPGSSVLELTEDVASSSPTVDRVVIRRLVTMAVTAEQQLTTAIRNTVVLLEAMDPSGVTAVAQISATLAQVLSRPN